MFEKLTLQKKECAMKIKLKQKNAFGGQQNMLKMFASLFGSLNSDVKLTMLFL